MRLKIWLLALTLSAAGAWGQWLEFRPAAHPLEGKPAPDFTLEDANGKKVSLSALKGKMVVLDFWATWCPPCVEGLPKIWRVMQMHPGVVFYAVNLQESNADVEKFLQMEKLAKLPVLLDKDGKVANAYQVTGIPETVIIGKDGVIRKIHVGLMKDVKKELGAVLK
ncbi:MAG: TlpA family protein disulfide reductase [Verrucomicrobiales bacterium]|jgi:thiol-disulfide isomerase/thioredoxin|nr:TlpA family protein disulfide reductase [Verrucomicrobiales bacterium]